MDGIRSDTLFWIDLEMTGLYIERDTILEIATLVTTNNLELIAEGPNLVIHQPEFILEGMDTWNTEQHGKSGLLAEVRRSTVTIAEAEELTLAFARHHCTEKKVPLCGNTVYQDRIFLRRYMPTLEAYFHYRLIDVSTLKELVRRWYPKDPLSFFDTEKKSNHRAFEDVVVSVEELKYYKAHFFLKERGEG